MNLTLIRSYYLTAKLGNITRASELLNITRAAVSKHIRLLEHELGNIKLMERFHSGIELTEKGKVFFEYAETVCDATESLKHHLTEQNCATSGVLKVIASSTIGGQWFSRHITEFMDLYPEILLQMIYEERKSLEFSRANTGTYVGLTNALPSDKQFYVVNRLGHYHLFPFAHPSYLEKYGTPSSFEDLGHHKLICYQFGEDFSDIQENEINCLNYLGAPKSKPRPPAIITDDAVACRTMVINGVGIGMLPRYMVKESGLIELLKGVYTPFSSGVYKTFLIYPHYLRTAPKVRVFKEFISQKIKLDEDFS